MVQEKFASLSWPVEKHCLPKRQPRHFRQPRARGCRYHDLVQIAASAGLAAGWDSFEPRHANVAGHRSARESRSTFNGGCEEDSTQWTRTPPRCEVRNDTCEVRGTHDGPMALLGVLIWWVQGAVSFVQLCFSVSDI